MSSDVVLTPVRESVYRKSEFCAVLQVKLQKSHNTTVSLLWVVGWLGPGFNLLEEYSST
jgi:hypothetical protein